MENPLKFSPGRALKNNSHTDKSRGDCKTVQGQLRDVREIRAARGGAFAAVLGDGSVVAGFLFSGNSGLIL